MRCLLLATLILFAHTASIANDQFADELEQFIGYWSIEKMVGDGVAAPKDEMEGLQIEFTQAKMVFTSIEEDDKEIYRFEINMNSSPKSINIITGEDDDAEVLKGIYKNEGDTITLCLAEDSENKRPAKFESKSGSDTTLIQLKLVK